MPIVELPLGRIEGAIVADGIERFANIPFAAPITPERRFRAPQPPEPWRGLRDGTRPGPTPPQFENRSVLNRGIYQPGWVQGDEYLNLNVWTPDRTAAAPVAVWIHGGALSSGHGMLPMYDPTSFARDGIVAVTLNYRVGVEGFVVPDGGDTNIGFRDQIAALTWVQENIRLFGGDPDRVTIFGQSAGGTSVSVHLASPASRGLFSRAILMSGAGDATLTPHERDRIARAVARGAGIEPSRDAFASADELTPLSSAFSLFEQLGIPAGSTAPFGIHVGDDIAPVSPNRAAAAGESAPVPLLLGFAAEEYLLWDWDDDRPLAEAEALVEVGRIVSDPAALLAEYRDIYPGESTRRLLRRIREQFVFVGPVLEFADGHAAAGNDTWLYEFAWRSGAQGGRVGAAHSVELPFVFDALERSGVENLIGPHAPQRLATFLHGVWSAFIRGEQPPWPQHRERTALRIDEEPTKIHDVRARERAAWARATVVLENLPD